MTSSASHIITDTDRRGAQVFAVDLAEALDGHARGVTALAPGAQQDGLDVDVLGTGRLRPHTLLELRRLMSRSRVTVAHGSSTLVACSLGGLLTDAPFVYRQISDQNFWAGSTSRRLRVTTYLRRASHVVALWEGAAATLTTVYKVPRERLSVIPNGVPTSRFAFVEPGERRAARHRFELPDRGPVVLALGALVPEKGVDVLIRALSHLPDHHLLVVGAGPEESRLRQLAAQVLPGRVTFHGPLADAGPAYAAADVIALASRGGDSMPAVLIEGALRGLPAVATPVQGIVDIVLPGRTGALVREAGSEHLAGLLDEVYQDRVQLGQAARQHCLGRFGINVVAEQWRGVLDAHAR